MGKAAFDPARSFAKQTQPLLLCADPVIRDELFDEHDLVLPDYMTERAFNVLSRMTEGRWQGKHYRQMA